MARRLIVWPVRGIDSVFRLLWRFGHSDG